MVSSKHFKPTEYRCHCGCGLEPTQDLLDKLDEIRDLYKSPIILTCAARCAAHNVKVGGARDSNHVKGTAADIEYTPQLAMFLRASLEHFNVYMEDPGATIGWRHIQLTPPASGKRIFWP